MAKKSLIAGEYIIEIADNGHVDVLRVFRNAKAIMTDIAKARNFTVENKWNTQDLGRHLVKAFGDGKTALFNDITVNRLPDGKIEIYQECKNVKETLRTIANQLDFHYEDTWNTQQFGSKLSNYLTEHKYEADKILQTKNLNQNRIYDVHCMKNAEFIKGKILDTLRTIKKEDIVNNENGFAWDKNAITLLFEKTKEETAMDIFLRLAIIDSTYSTQMTRRYYGLEELSNAIFLIKQNNPNKSLAELFINYLNNRDITPFEYTNKENDSKTNLFSEKYGIGKDGEDKGISISLISKYAYFETKGIFPIYDSIACEMIPLIWKRCAFSGKYPSLSENTNLSGTEKLNRFLDTLDAFKKNLGEQINNDHLDRLLWFVGKIIRGNLSLVLSRKDYQLCCKNDLIKKFGDETKFRIEDVELRQISFLEKDTLQYRFFELAKLLN